MIKFKILYILGFLGFIFLFSCAKPKTKKFGNNAIATAHPLASLAGKQMYEQHGNAFDAAVAAAFCLAVVEPSMSGIGGRLQAIFQDSLGNIAGIDASTQVPLNYLPTNEKFSYGYKTIGIPGVVAGLIKLHEEHGSLTLQQVLAPAIRYAEEGFNILPLEAKRQQSLKDIIVEFEGTKAHFLNKEGNAFQAGELVVQKALANTLKQIAEKGKAGFYEGVVAQKMVADIQANGGILTLEDLKNYKALDAEILQGRFKKNQVYALNLPSYGAITIMILQIMDQLPLTTSEEAWAKQFNEVTALAYAYRKHQQNKDSLAKVLSYQQAEKWANTIQSEPLNLVADAIETLPESWTATIGHTTHLTATDDQGNAISLTQTLGPNMGSKVASKDLGFLYAVSLGGYLGEYKPGDRSNSHITPTLFINNGKLQLALGAAGGSRIVTAVTQVAHRYFAQKISLNRSLFLPRIYPYQDTLWIEDHQEVKMLNAEINQHFYPIKMIDQKARFGRVHAIAFDSLTKTWIGAADPDWEGNVEYYSHP